jgi:hypothetical protein
VLLSKPAKIPDPSTKVAEKIKSTPTVTVAASTVAIQAAKAEPEEEQPVQDPPQEIETATARKVNHDLAFHIEGSMLNFDDSSAHDPQGKGVSSRGSGSISMFPIRSHVVVSSRVDVRVGGVSKVRPRFFTASNTSRDHLLCSSWSVRLLKCALHPLPSFRCPSPCPCGLE